MGRIAGDAKDGSRLAGTYTNALGETIPAAQFGSFGSAITYSGSDNRYYATNDRGFGDGSTRSLDRFHVLDITVDPAAKRVDAILVETRLLTNEAGENLVGLASDFAVDSRRSLRFDPEGLRIGPQGTLYHQRRVWAGDRRVRPERPAAPLAAGPGEVPGCPARCRRSRSRPGRTAPGASPTRGWRAWRSLPTAGPWSGSCRAP